MDIKKHLSEEEIAIYADAINDNNWDLVPQNLIAHIQSCEQCSAEAAIVAELSKELSIKTNRKKQLNSKSWLLPVSAVAAAGITVMVILKLIPAHQTSSSEKIATTTKNQIVTKKNRITDNTKQITPAGKPLSSDNKPTETTAANQHEKPLQQKEMLALYTPDERLEKLYNSFKSTYRGETVKVITNTILEVPGSDSLKWSNPGHEELVVEFYDHSGKKISIQSTHQQGIKIPVQNSGLYYWKLINQDYDLLYVGKIIVR